VTPRPHCTLRLALGQAEECPGPSCELWDGDHCVLEPVTPELGRSPALACHLLELRLALECAGEAAVRARTRSLFSQRLNEEQAAEA